MHLVFREGNLITCCCIKHCGNEGFFCFGTNKTEIFSVEIKSRNNLHSVETMSVSQGDLKLRCNIAAADFRTEHRKEK